MSHSRSSRSFPIVTVRSSAMLWKKRYLIWIANISFFIVILWNYSFLHHHRNIVISSLMVVVEDTETPPTTTTTRRSGDGDTAATTTATTTAGRSGGEQQEDRDIHGRNNKLICVDPFIPMSCNWKKHGSGDQERRNYVKENIGNEGYLQHIENKKKEYSRLIANHDPGATTTTTPTKTLALADPVLRDGYRNQVFRLTAFVKYALVHGFEEILLPSIRWQHEATRFDGERPYRIPFDLLFDVDHWNRQEGLPRLVEYNATLHHDWDPYLGMFRYVDCDVLDTYYNTGPAGKDIIMQRIRNVSATHPYGHGGGEQLGTLWFDYLSSSSSSSRYRNVSIHLWNRSSKTTTTTTTTFDAIETSVMNALKPSLKILNAKSIQHLESSSYLAIHPRVEPDMLKHPKCLELKERNLTRIFEYIRTFDKFQSVDNVLVAINLDFMTHGSAPVVESLKKIHSENQHIFQQTLSSGLQRLDKNGNNMTLFLAGKSALMDSTVVDIPECSRSLAGSILDFALAVNADMFLGTHVSSWSVSVWKARFLQGKGDENYAITPSGIEKVNSVPQFNC